MGYGSWSDDSFKNISRSHVGKTRDQLFTNTAKRVIDSEMDPMNLGIRESRDSDNHPNSVAIIVALDETGSMGMIPHDIVTERLNHLMSTLVDNKIPDAQVMFLGIGDHPEDRFPLQVGQFESEAELLDKWLRAINLEGCGGGQQMESYLLAWLVAARHTSLDCFEKRGQKGFLFTIGDEASWNKVPSDFLKSRLGYKEAEDVSDVQLLAEAQRQWHIFHIHCQGGHYRDNPKILGYWKKMLGEGLIVLEDHKDICAVIAGKVAVMLGADINQVVQNFDSKTALVVREATKNDLAKVGQDQLTTTGQGIVQL